MRRSVRHHRTGLEYPPSKQYCHYQVAVYITIGVQICCNRCSELVIRQYNCCFAQIAKMFRKNNHLCVEHPRASSVSVNAKVKSQSKLPAQHHDTPMTNVNIFADKAFRNTATTSVQALEVDSCLTTILELACEPVPHHAFLTTDEGGPWLAGHYYHLQRGSSMWT